MQQFLADSPLDPAFVRANDEIAQLGDTFAPQLGGLRSSGASNARRDPSDARELLAGLDRDAHGMGDHVTTEIHALDAPYACS